MYGDLGWISLENRIIEKKLVFAGRVASRTTMGEQNISTDRRGGMRWSKLTNQQ